MLPASGGSIPKRSSSRQVPAHRSDAGISLEAVRALNGELPILGVCLGHQCIGAMYWRARRPRDTAAAWDRLTDRA